ARSVFELFISLPRVPDSRLDGRCGNSEIRKKIAMRPPLAVRRLPRRRGQEFLDESDVAAEQKAAVEQQRALLTILRVAGELAPADRQISEAGDRHLGRGER